MKNKVFEKLLKKKNEFVIKVNNKNEFNKLMELCEKFNTDIFLAIRWANECRPTKFDPYNEFNSTSGRYIYFKRNFRSFTMTQSPIGIRYWDAITSEIIDFNDLFKGLFKQEIHITRKDNKVHAVLKEDGKVIKHSVARCHPEDEFDFQVGSELAYNRLFGLETIKFPIKFETERTTTLTSGCERAKIGDYIVFRGGNLTYICVGEDTFMDCTGATRKCTNPYEYLVSNGNPPILNCKFVPLYNSDRLTEGKIYEVCNGRFYDDGRHCELPVINFLQTQADLNKFVSYIDDGNQIVILED